MGPPSYPEDAEDSSNVVHAGEDLEPFMASRGLEADIAPHLTAPQDLFFLTQPQLVLGKQPSGLAVAPYQATLKSDSLYS